MVKHPGYYVITTGCCNYCPMRTPLHILGISDTIIVMDPSYLVCRFSTASTHTAGYMEEE